MQNCTEITKNLFLGNLSSSKDKQFIASLDLIVNLSMYPIDIDTALDKVPEIMNIQIYDEPHEDLSIYFNTTFKKINDILNNKDGRVLVYCKIGKSRSVSIIINYLMTKFNISYELAFIEILKKKSEVGPNFGFIKQLKKHYTYRLHQQNIQHDTEKLNNKTLTQLKQNLELKINGKKSQEEWTSLKKDREILRYIESIL
jgi:protein-tyrosine phosphatase